MDPIASIAFKKDSSLAMLLAAQARGWSLFYMQQEDLYLARGQARARLRPLEVFNDAQRWFTLGTEQDAALAELDVILMRKDPPFDNEFLYSTHLLEQAERDIGAEQTGGAGNEDHGPSRGKEGVLGRERQAEAGW